MSELLFTPKNIGTVEIKNRVVMAPMVMGTGNLDGTVSQKMLDYYTLRAKGGVGLIITEATRVNDKSGPLSPLQLAMSHDYHIEPFKKLAGSVHENGAKIFCQLHHPGRQTLSLLVAFWNLSVKIGRHMNLYWKIFFKLTNIKWLFKNHWFYPATVSASNIMCNHQNQKTRPLKIGEIKKLVNDFAKAAYRVKLADGDGVELHAAHGYLIQQFLSPYTNRRTDIYGGCLENRMRFLKEIIFAIREKCGEDFPIIVRVSVDEFYKEIGLNQGLILEEGLEICKELDKLKIDAIDVSSANYETMNYWLEPISFETGWRKYLAKAVKEVVSVPVLAANLIRTPAQAEEQLNENIQDFISLGRPLLADPMWANKAKEHNDKNITRCINCLNCFETMLDGATRNTSGSCAVNPHCCNETDPQPINDGYKKSVVIIGAGIAGMTVACQLKDRNFLPIIIEQNEKVGGQLNLANKPPLKEKIDWCAVDALKNCENREIEIKYNFKATKENILSLNPYAVVIATGAHSFKPRIKGAEGDNVVTVTSILNGAVNPVGKRVAVVGSGMTGLETAEMLSKNNDVFIIEMAKKLAPEAYHQNVDDIIPRLKKNNVKFLLGYKLSSIHKDYITLSHEKAKHALDIDLVVLSLGVKSEVGLYNELKPIIKNLYIVGDANKVGRIASATRSAYVVAKELK